MSAAIVERHDLDVQVVQTAINIDVLDARIRELHVSVGVRQIMLARPICDF
jgi:hypothetical protein